jgi:hypothetical protein
MAPEASDSFRLTTHRRAVRVRTPKKKALPRAGKGFFASAALLRFCAATLGKRGSAASIRPNPLDSGDATVRKTDSNSFWLSPRRRLVLRHHPHTVTNRGEQSAADAANAALMRALSAGVRNKALDFDL